MSRERGSRDLGGREWGLGREGVGTREGVSE